ncbi:hydroxymethylbilane synthase [Salinisphaera sp. Q1T1-3]|uniref:hydroxymethylbilane synthase n=1 Tax=Salinisphaera sp. Q1T1-3 TaxID=2321229 RepID=UPI000E751A6B|nr:hydroxymethylbilane synthase [Salinisphaera sp. Q1T1-3]RJS91393.1 hydroxymethylbilane synthase [Salinisphaera sp. Q1T1-3]
MTETGKPRTLRIATRQSQLALWQAEHVKARLATALPDVEVVLLPITTEGDRVTDRPLSAIGGKGLFLKELEAALEAGEADLAVHSMKDVPAELPPGFALPVVLAPASPLDAFVSNDYDSPEALPAGAVVGTSSLRRAAMIKHLRPDVEIQSLRGNVQTRLAKLDAGDYDAILLACAGLERLEMAGRIRCELSPEQSLPAIGQGVLGIEIRADDTETAERIARLDDEYTHIRIDAERAVNARLEGSCHLPIAAHATHDGRTLSLTACVGKPDGSVMVRDAISGPVDEAAEIGHRLAERLLAAGADRILAELG